MSRRPKARLELLIETVETGQRENVFAQKDPRTRAHILWATLHGHLALPINLDRFAWSACEDETVVEEMMGLVLVE